MNPPADATAKNESTTFLMIRFAITYSVFLLIILLLMVHLHRVSTTRSEEDFWNQDQSTFESAVSLLDNNFTTMDSITRQLSMNTKLYRLATMKSTDDNDFYLSGLTMKQSLASYMYSYNELPFSTYFVYLRNSGYIISVNTFNSEQLYYIRNYLSSGANFNEWHDLLNNNLTKDSALYPLSDFMLPEIGNAYLYVLNMDVLTYKDIPATVAFHINEQTLRKIFSGVSLGDTGYIIAVDAQDQPVFSLSEDKNTSSEKDLNTLTESVLSLSYDDNNTCVHNDTHIMRIASKTNDWTFYLVQPESIYPSDYQFIFLLILFAAIIGGLIMIFILVRNNMRPILHLDDQLQETLHANTQLIEEAAAIRPVLYDNYLRQLMSGVITTPDELSFIQNYLHLEDPSLHYYVLYGVTYENDPAADTFPNENTSTESSESMKDIIAGLLARYFSYENNLYLCSPKKHIYAVLIPFSGTADEILITLQEKALKFHSELLEEYSIWFFAGIGLSCSFTNIWESYQQAKDAAGYTSKNYIFLPYEMLKKTPMFTTIRLNFQPV
ncbi:MAG: AraC family transcriptional regulator [Roseburia intestinalis]